MVHRQVSQVKLGISIHSLVRSWQGSIYCGQLWGKVVFTVGSYGEMDSLLAEEVWSVGVRPLGTYLMLV